MNNKRKDEALKGFLDEHEKNPVDVMDTPSFLAGVNWADIHPLVRWNVVEKDGLPNAKRSDSYLVLRNLGWVNGRKYQLKTEIATFDAKEGRFDLDNVIAWIYLGSIDIKGATDLLMSFVGDEVCDDETCDLT